MSPNELTEALVGHFIVPEIDSQIVCWHEGLLIAIQRDRVDVVGVGVGEYSLGHCFDLDSVHVLDHRYADGSDITLVANIYMLATVHVSEHSRRRNGRVRCGSDSSRVSLPK